MERAEIVAAVERAFTLSDGPNAEPLHVHASWSVAHNRPEGIAARHAIETLARGTRERWSHGDGSSFTTLATRFVTVGAPYVQLVHAIEHPRVAGTLIWRAWRLYDVQPDVRPHEALAQLVVRYGLDVRCGEYVSRFIADMTVEGGSPNPVGVADEPDDNFDLSAGLVPLDAMHTRVVFAYCIDLAAYWRAVSERR